MRKFASLIKTIDSTNKTNLKVEALSNYFLKSSNEDMLWAIALMSHRRPKRPMTTTLLRQWASEESNLPKWLFEESYHIVGDLAETISLLITQDDSSLKISLTECIKEIISLKDKRDDEKKKYILKRWKGFNNYERFVFNKILTGGFRIGISQKLMTRALSKAVNIEEHIISHRLMGEWDPQSTTLEKLIINPDPKDQLSKPYPFYLAYPIDLDLFSKSDVREWHIEHKWDGMRAQLIVRDDNFYLWSRGEDLITKTFPELKILSEQLPNGTVIDGELLPFKNEVIGDFNTLQKRIGKKNISKKDLNENPIILMAYDLLEVGGKDIRTQPLFERQKKLEFILKKNSNLSSPIRLSNHMKFESWDEVAKERENASKKKSEGLMIKRKNSKYEVGRIKGNWWKWKSDPKTIDAVLTYAMRGHGRRTNLYTDYTFALWNNGELVTFAKAYSGLNDKEIKEVDRFVKQNTLNRFGPVRQVKPQLVFEIAFEGVSLSSRHKSGVSVRFPRILRQRHDKKIAEANSVGDIKKLLV